MKRIWFATVVAAMLTHAYVAIGTAADNAPALKITKGLKISIVGNTLAERMQHDGWMETMLQSRFPDQQLVVRNLGFSADALTEQLRVAGFGSQDDWLNRTQADVVFGFFGFNESFAGEAGLNKFQSDLAIPWHDQLSDPLALLADQAVDDHPLVRLEAIRAASFFRTSKAAEIALSSITKPQDRYLKYTLGQSLKQLQKFKD